ncbi:MAG: response regulator, partial [Erysipelotrichaceae bacterium]
MSNYKEKILVVEDDIQIQNFICYLLEAEGFNCIKANDGHSAIVILANEQIDIMLLDLGLPDIDGMEVISKVREWSELPIIVVSARDQDKEKANALDL